MNGFPSHSSFPYWQNPFGHCLGCRCFQHGGQIWTTTTTPQYQPRHRKPGPAQ